MRRSWSLPHPPPPAPRPPPSPHDTERSLFHFLLPILLLNRDNRRWPCKAREDDTLIPNWNNGAGGGNGGVGIGGGSSSGASVFGVGDADEALSAAEVGAGRRNRRPSAESVPVKREEDKRRYGTSA